MAKSRNYMFTEFVNLGAKFDDSRIVYLVCQREKAPSSGKIHLQGYVELQSQYSMAKVKEILGCPKAHVEIRGGSQEQAIKYCTKIETRENVDAQPFEIGKKKSIGGDRKSAKNAKCERISARVEKEDPEFKEWEDDLIDGRKKRLRLRAPRHKGKWLWMYKTC